MVRDRLHEEEHSAPASGDLRPLDQPSRVLDSHGQRRARLLLRRLRLHPLPNLLGAPLQPRRRGQRLLLDGRLPRGPTGRGCGPPLRLDGADPRHAQRGRL